MERVNQTTLNLTCQFVWKYFFFSFPNFVCHLWIIRKVWSMAHHFGLLPWYIAFSISGCVICYYLLFSVCSIGQPFLSFFLSLFCRFFCSIGFCCCCVFSLQFFCFVSCLDAMYTLFLLLVHIYFVFVFCFHFFIFGNANKSGYCLYLPFHAVQCGWKLNEYGSFVCLLIVVVFDFCFLLLDSFSLSLPSSSVSFHVSEARICVHQI